MSSHASDTRAKFYTVQRYNRVLVPDERFSCAIIMKTILATLQRIEFFTK